MSVDEQRRKHAWLRALGGNELPSSIQLADGCYRHVRTYKHDFFAATGLYEGPGGRAILKVGRVEPFLGFPMRWLGARLARRELDVYAALADVQSVPSSLGNVGATGLTHVFVEGHPLQRHESVGDDFFPQLDELLAELHQRGIAYVDLEKRENILVGDDGRPWLIDFQISWWWPKTDTRKRRNICRLVPDPIGRYILSKLQQADRYHLLKHWRRHRPDQLTSQQIQASRRSGSLIKAWRAMTRGPQLFRRWVLKQLTGSGRSPKQDGPEFVDPPEV